MIPRWTIPLCVLAFVSCKQEKNDRKTTQAPVQGANQIIAGDASSFRSLVTPQQLVLAKITPIPADSIASEVNSEENFFNVSPTKTSPCDAEFNKILAKATNNTIVLEGQVNMAACKNAEGNRTYTYTEFTMNILFQVYCDKGNLAQYNGKPFDQLSSIDTCPGGTSQSLLSHTGSLRGQALVSGQQYTYTGTFYGEFATADHKPCTYKSAGGAKGTYQNCRDSRASTTSELRKADGTILPQSTPDYRVATFTLNNVGSEGHQAGTYYTNGVMPFVINDWQGNMTYTSATTPPKWTANRNNEQKNGTFSYVASSLALGSAGLHETLPSPLKLWFR